MYIAAPEYIWTIIAAILVAVFLLLVQKFILTGRTFHIKVTEKEAIVSTLNTTLKEINKIITTNKKEEEANADDEDEDLDDIVDDFLK